MMPKATLPVLLVIIVVKLTAYRMVSGEVGKPAVHHCLPMPGIIAAMITSLLAFTGISLALLLGPGYEAAIDDWLQLAASGFIMFNAHLDISSGLWARSWMNINMMSC